ncbi:hypothetical protein [Treponema lecithinolyticum]|uniref:hypothetical protein n=1 Tax=Treponema lecithinolyticum TaxID=53418 RepID=UPI003617E46B
MGFEQLLLAAKDWGPTAITTIIAVIISYIFRQQSKNTEEDIKRAKEFKESLSSGLGRLEENLNKTITDLKKEVDTHRKEIEMLKMDKLEKDDFYKDMGGWRTELNRLQDLIITQNNATAQKIIELWKEKR